MYLYLSDPMRERDKLALSMTKDLLYVQITIIALSGCVLFLLFAIAPCRRERRSVTIFLHIGPTPRSCGTPHRAIRSFFRRANSLT